MVWWTYGAAKEFGLQPGLRRCRLLPSDSTNGVEIVVGEMQNVTIQRGLLPVDQKIEMIPSGITVDAGLGKVTIQSLTEITLSVAGGLSTITLTPAGITIQGLLVQIN